MRFLLPSNVVLVGIFLLGRFFFWEKHFSSGGVHFFDLDWPIKSLASLDLLKSTLRHNQNFIRHNQLFDVEPTSGSSKKCVVNVKCGKNET